MRLMGLVLGVVVLWQGVQVLTLGAVGVPGVFVVPLGPEGGGRKGQREEGVSIFRKGAPGKAAAPEMAAPEPDRGHRRQAGISSGEIEGWIKAQAREFVGGMDAEGNMLYRFDVWIAPPSSAKHRIVSVDYAFDAPSAKTTNQSSKDGKTGFRVKFGGLSCAASIAVNVTFDDGETRKAKVDGCEILD